MSEDYISECREPGLNEEHSALIDSLPFDIVVTMAACIVLVLWFVEFVRRFSSQSRRATASPVS